MVGCIFCQIAKKEIPAKVVFEDEEVMVFPDIHPVAPLHLLIIPKEHIDDLTSPQMEDGKIWAKMTEVVKDLVRRNNLSGYRLAVNGGTVKLINHLHLHLMGDVSAERKL